VREVRWSVTVTPSWYVWRHCMCTGSCLDCLDLRPLFASSRLFGGPAGRGMTCPYHPHDGLCREGGASSKTAWLKQMVVYLHFDCFCDINQKRAVEIVVREFVHLLNTCWKRRLRYPEKWTFQKHYKMIVLLRPRHNTAPFFPFTKIEHKQKGWWSNTSI
jgi:hypothetical protein